MVRQVPAGGEHDGARCRILRRHDDPDECPQRVADDRHAAGIDERVLRQVVERIVHVAHGAAPCPYDRQRVTEAERFEIPLRRIGKHQ